MKKFALCVSKIAAGAVAFSAVGWGLEALTGKPAEGLLVHLLFGLWLGREVAKGGGRD